MWKAEAEDVNKWAVAVVLEKKLAGLVAYGLVAYGLVAYGPPPERLVSESDLGVHCVCARLCLLGDPRRS